MFEFSYDFVAFDNHFQIATSFFCRALPRMIKLSATKRQLRRA